MQVSRLNHISAASGVAYTETRGATTLSNWTDVGPKAISSRLSFLTTRGRVIVGGKPAKTHEAGVDQSVSAEHEAMKRQACRLHYLLDRIRPEDVA